MGNGLQPNLHNLYRDVRVTERHHLTNYNSGQPGYIEHWAWKSVVAYPANVRNANVTSSPHPLNVGVLFRGTTTPGGFWVGNSTADVVIEGSRVAWSGSACIIAGADDERLHAVNNDCEE